jgi:hypothetical protein
MDVLDLARGATVEATVDLGKAENGFILLRLFVRSGCTMCNRYALKITRQDTAYWYAGDWQPNEDPATHAPAEIYRLSVRDDTCVQVYRGPRLLASFPASYEIGFAFPTRGNWIEWEVSAGTERPAVKTIALDLAGPFQPV